MLIYIIATVSTTLLIALIIGLGIVLIASQLWITTTDSDVINIKKTNGKNDVSGEQKNSLTHFNYRKIDRLIERLIKNTIDDQHFNNL